MKIRINEDIVYECECKNCAYKTKAWALESIENNEITRVPNVQNCPECNKPLTYKVIERLTHV